METWRDDSHQAQHTTKGNRTKTSGKFKKGLPGWRVRGSGTACAGYGRYPQAQLLPRASSSPPPTPPSPSPSAHGSDQIASRSRKEFASNPRASNFEVVEDYEGGGSWTLLRRSTAAAGEAAEGSATGVFRWRKEERQVGDLQMIGRLLCVLSWVNGRSCIRKFFFVCAFALDSWFGILV